VGRGVASGGINGAIVGRRTKDRGFHSTRPTHLQKGGVFETRGGGLLVSVVTDDGANHTILMGTDVLGILRPVCRTHDLDIFAMAK